MKHGLILLIFAMMFTTEISAQNVIIEENFDGFTAGDKLVLTNNDQSVWDTWSSSPGNSEDAAVSNQFSFSPENSLYLANNNDVVLLTNDLTEGRYKMAFKMLIASGRIGYFNMLHDFAGGDSEWAFQVYFNANGNGSVDAGKTDAASFNYEYDTWFDVITIVDLNDDFATLYIGGQEIISWKWSLGTSGGGTMVKLDAVNFYGITSGGSSGMYIDDVVFSEVQVPEAPANLKAEIVDDKTVVLSWDAPSLIPDNYVLIRNNQVIDNSIMDTTFSENPYPGDNFYTVRAHTIGLGYSNGSNEANGYIPGGFDRDYVLFEIGTGTGCFYCPGSAMGAVDLVENDDQVIIIKYHNYNPTTDPFSNGVSAQRAGNYYQISGYPTSFADGTFSVVGGSNTQSLFEPYHQHYLQRKTRKALYTLEVDVVHLSGYNYRAEINVTEHSGFVTEQKTLHTALTESDIDYNWQNQDKVHWTCRNMFPDALGTPMDFSEEPTQNLGIEFSLTEDYVKDNCEFVVFLQADPSKEVMVATKVNMADILILNEEKVHSGSIEVYPNPASDYIYFSRAIDQPFDLIDISGKKVLSGKADHRIAISHLDRGIYFLNIDGSSPRKIIIH
jgi:hypothetical protein